MATYTYYLHFDVDCGDTGIVEPSSNCTFLAIIGTGTTQAMATSAVTSATTTTALIFRTISSSSTVSFTSTASVCYAAARVIRPGFEPSEVKGGGSQLLTGETQPLVIQEFQLYGTEECQRQCVPASLLYQFQQRMSPFTGRPDVAGNSLLAAFIDKSARHLVIGTKEEYYKLYTGSTCSVDSLYGFWVMDNEGYATAGDGRVFPLKNLKFCDDRHYWNCNSQAGGCYLDGCYQVAPPTECEFDCPFEGDCSPEVCSDSCIDCTSDCTLVCEDTCQDDLCLRDNICLYDCALDCRKDSITYKTCRVSWYIINHFGAGAGALNYVIPFSCDEIRSGLTGTSGTITSYGTLRASQTVPATDVAYNQTLDSVEWSFLAIDGVSQAIQVVLYFNTADAVIPDNPPLNPVVTINGTTAPQSGVFTDGDGTASWRFAVNIDFTSITVATVGVEFTNGAY